MRYISNIKSRTTNNVHWKYKKLKLNVEKHSILSKTLILIPHFYFLVPSFYCNISSISTPATPAVVGVAGGVPNGQFMGKLALRNQIRICPFGRLVSDKKGKGEGEALRRHSPPFPTPFPPLYGGKRMIDRRGGSSYRV